MLQPHEEVSRKMRDTASETQALPLEETATSSFTSMFNVGRSMFDVHSTVTLFAKLRG